MSEKPKLPYYSFDKVCSYNAVYNFIIGARGLGKTYGAKKRVIRNAIRKGDEFIYLRRYSEEIKASKETFFSDVFHEFPDWDFRVNGYVAEMAPADTRDQKKRKWKIIGYFIQLSNAQSKKSVSFPRVTTILFDEFIIEKGLLQYLPNEAKAFNDFYSTVDRWQDRTTVFFLANSVSIMNPYFLEYGIKPDDENEFVRKADGFILTHFARAENFAKGVLKTRFGAFIEGTEYAEYSVGSNFADNHTRLLGDKPPEASYMFTVEGPRGTFSVWVSHGYTRYWIQAKRPKSEYLYTLIPANVDEGKVLLTYNHKLVQTLRTAYRKGRTRFDSQNTREAFVEIARK